MLNHVDSVHDRDVRFQLHPNTNARLHEEIGPLVIERGEGVHVFDDEGRSYIEAMSGLWNVALGFSEERLVAAAARQMAKLPFYHSFSHKANEPAVDLAERLVALAPKGLSKVFFTNSGSEANDTVVKMVWYRNNAIGRPRKKKFLARDNAYHGVTVASGSLTGLRASHADFDLPAIPVRRLTCPHHYRYALPGEGEEAFAERLAQELEQAILQEGPDTVAAFIGEPLMGAGGVRPPPAGYWRRVQEICRRYDVLVVVDEVITGFGRLGTMFGSEVYEIRPDMMVVSKQLTSSYMPLAAVLVSDAIYGNLADNSARIGTFGHGFTTTGHPVACAVALENLAIIEERGLVANAASAGAAMIEGLRRLEDHPLVGEVRGAGLIAAVELVADKTTKMSFPPSAGIGSEFFKKAHRHGLIVRAIGDSIALCPPLIIKGEEVDELLRRFAATLDDIADWVETRRRAGAIEDVS